MNQHKYTGYEKNGTYHLELADGSPHLIGSGSTRYSEGSRRRGSSTGISTIRGGKDSVDIIENLVGAETLHVGILSRQRHYFSNHLNDIQRSKVIPIIGCLCKTHHGEGTR